MLKSASNACYVLIFAHAVCWACQKVLTVVVFTTLMLLIQNAVPVAGYAR
jgi:hypothetical protein